MNSFNSRLFSYGDNFERVIYPILKNIFITNGYQHGFILYDARDAIGWDSTDNDFYENQQFWVELATHTMPWLGVDPASITETGTRVIRGFYMEIQAMIYDPISNTLIPDGDNTITIYINHRDYYDTLNMLDANYENALDAYLNYYGGNDVQGGNFVNYISPFF